MNSTAKTLLMVVDDEVGGGTFKVGERLAAGLAADRRILFACARTPATEDGRRQLAALGIEIVPLWADSTEILRTTWDDEAAAALLARTDPDLVYFIDSSDLSNLALKRAARALGLPHAAMVNSIERAPSTVTTDLEQRAEAAARGAGAAIFVSETSRAEFVAKRPNVAVPSFVVANGVPDAFFRPVDPAVRSRLRRELGVDDDGLMLLLPGRIEERKGQRLALDALARIRERSGLDGLRLVLVGYATEVEARLLRDRIAAAGLADVVAHLGMRADVDDLLDAADVVLVPSSWEADGLVSKEAMAKGRPAIVSDLPSVRNQGHDPALIVPAPDASPEATIEGLARVIDDLRRGHEARAAIGARLRAIAERRYTMARMVAAHREILDRIPSRVRPGVGVGEGVVVERRRRPVGALLRLDFRDPAQCLRVLRDGWGNVDPDGIWCVGARARLAFATRRPVRFVTLGLRGYGLAAPGRPRSIAVTVNGRPAATWVFEDLRWGRRTIRLVLPRPTHRFVVQLRVLEPTSPHDLGLGDDRRHLGLFVRSLRIETGLVARVLGRIARLLGG